MELFDILFEVFLEDKAILRQFITAPREVHERHFMVLFEQVRNDPRPLRLKMSRDIVIWDEFEKRQKVLTNSIEAWKEGDFV